MKNKKERNKKILFSILLVIIFLSFCGIMKYTEKKENEEKTMLYSELIEALENGRVEEMAVRKNQSNVAVKMKDGTEKIVIIADASEFINFVSEKMEKNNKVKMQVDDAGISESFKSRLILIMIMMFSLASFRLSLSGGKFNIGKKKAKITFKDVAGIEEVKEQLEDIIDYLKDPKKYSEMGAVIPKGILISGSPGNGKTLLAKAMSGEAEVKFFQVAGSSFDEMFVGVGASRVRKLFDEAKRNAPAIIFIDEIDSVARSRYTKRSDNEQTLNQLLEEMDGFESSDNIIVIAATNHIEVLDEAILRPGRFDRKVYIPNPDVRARELILELHAKNKKISSEVSLKEIAQKTVGFSGADLKNILNEAAIYAVKLGNNEITKEAMEEAIARVIVGLKRKNAFITEEEKHLTAIHESGHAVISALIRPEIRNFCISIEPRGNAGGYNFFDESKVTYQKKADLLKQIKVLYGGRAAEEVILRDVSTGSANDLEKASKIALQMVTRFAMNNSMLVKIGNEQEYNEAIDKDAVKKADEICKDAYEDVKGRMAKHQKKVEELARILEEKECLSQEEVAKFMAENFNL